MGHVSRRSLMMARGVRRVRERRVFRTRVQRRWSHQCGGKPDAPEASDDAVTQRTLHTARIQPGQEKTRERMGLTPFQHHKSAGLRAAFGAMALDRPVTD